MANYRWDFGFDFNAVQVNGRSFLASGFIDLGTNEPATPLNGRVDLEDSIHFKVFNLTEEAAEEGYEITGGSLSFSAGDVTQVETSPFDTAPSISSLGEAGSTASSPTFGSHEFPVWTLHNPLTVDNRGTFLFTVEIIVDGPNNSTRHFRVDPEMIVWGPGNS